MTVSTDLRAPGHATSSPSAAWTRRATMSEMGRELEHGEPPDEGGDPACWAHLFEDEEDGEEEGEEGTDNVGASAD
jgi:hypothetical protein